MPTLWTIAPSHQGCAESSSAAAENNKCQKPENHRSHHHDCEAIGGFYKVQEGLDLRAGIACGRLLDFIEHLGSYFRTLVK
jgi:hypothetical protein